MAETIQNIAAPPDLIPLNTPVQDGINPLMFLTFQDKVELTGSTAGNEATAIVTMTLPAGYAWQLNSFVVTLQDTTDIEYTSAALLMYYNIRPGNAVQQLWIPLDVQTAYDYRKPSQIAGITFAASLECETPFRMFSGGGPNAQYLMYITSGADQAISACDLFYAISFLGYSVGQWQSSGIFSGIQTR